MILELISKQVIWRIIRYSREGGGPSNVLKNTDSRLCGNDDIERTDDEKEF